jgi:hypothetical protein
MTLMEFQQSIIFPMIVTHLKTMCVITALSFLPGKSATPSISFEQLKPSQRLVVDYRSQGCYETLRYVLVFTRTSKLEVEVYSAKVGRYGTGNEKPDKRIGSLSLSGEQEGRLENLLKIYRMKKGGGFSDIDRVKFIQMEGDKVLNKEYYFDKSGLTVFPDDLQSPKMKLPRALSIQQLVITARQVNKKVAERHQ